MRDPERMKVPWDINIYQEVECQWLYFEIHHTSLVVHLVINLVNIRGHRPIDISKLMNYSLDTKNTMRARYCHAHNVTIIQIHR